MFLIFGCGSILSRWYRVLSQLDTEVSIVKVRGRSTCKLVGKLGKFKAGLRNSIIIELGIGFNIAFCNSIGIVIEIGIERSPGQYCYRYWYCNLHSANIGIPICYWKTHSLSIGIGVVIAKHLQQILSMLLELQINFSSIDVKMASEITLFLDNTVIYKCKITKKGIHKL